ncbi:hypothetical protein CGG82_17870 [Vibrio parahaemolyticus]|uniref:hypothetical protein n=1 Tax=Vibrio parahaemolyticus TaxID=670 RepID=UPI00111F7978|nr:hypothetical protein [Vibrio parahaemolyticus]TOR11913.1 hypothetical protein CGG82_17870 [Vibrio parahaemolyticus]UJW92759.1 hypothetical protein JHS83_25370 [Vibrio parahaemolyticus]UJX06924.1 hypothetical protein JHS88_25020 [Vibrio parahaemolyticus]WCZ09837.1 hypothetical protein GSR97_26700 [Vibrio parahaemolyticus]
MSLYEELKREFESKGIPVEQTDFYDHPNFLKAEQADPSYLIKFAKFVAEKDYSQEYLEKAEKVITDVVEIMSLELIKNGREGACVDISGILARILEQKGVWCACIKGSTTIEFPQSSGIDNTYYWSADHGNFTAGHAWVYAPPFSIIDITLNQQPHPENKKAFIPKVILVKDAVKTVSNVEDIISPEVRFQMQQQGIPSNLMLDIGSPELEIVQSSIPALSVVIQDTKFKYSPVAVHASIEGLPDMTNMKFDGDYPYQMYKKKFENQVENIT